MAKDKSNVSYFSHDSNARNDENIMMVRAKHWRSWYWQYFAIIEILSEAKWYKLDKNMLPAITSLYQIDNDLITTLFDTGLLLEKDGFIWSESLLNRMYMRDNKTKQCSEAWIKGMKKRRLKKHKNNDSSNAPSDKVVITIKWNEIKWNKIKEKKGDLDSFLEAWNIVKEKDTCWHKTIKITKDIQTARDKLNKELTKEEITIGMLNYFKDISNRDESSWTYFKHRFSMLEFISQKNWVREFLNK